MYFDLRFSSISNEAFPNALFQFTNYQIIKTRNMISMTEMFNFGPSMLESFIC